MPKNDWQKIVIMFAVKALEKEEMITDQLLLFEKAKAAFIASRDHCQQFRHTRIFPIKKEAAAVDSIVRIMNKVYKIDGE